MIATILGILCVVLFIIIMQRINKIAHSNNDVINSVHVVTKNQKKIHDEVIVVKEAQDSVKTTLEESRLTILN